MDGIGMVDSIDMIIMTADAAMRSTHTVKFCELMW